MPNICYDRDRDRDRHRDRDLDRDRDRDHDGHGPIQHLTHTKLSRSLKTEGCSLLQTKGDGQKLRDYRKELR
jgi:hypothetical protein